MKLLGTLHLIVLAALVPASAQTPAAPAKPNSAPAATKPKPAAATKPAPSAAAKPEAANSADPVVLMVGDEKLTKSQFEALVASLPDELKAQANGPNKRRFAEQLVEMKSLAYEARRRKLDQTPEAKTRIALQLDNVLASELFRTLNADLKVDDAALE